MERFSRRIVAGIQKYQEVSMDQYQLYVFGIKMAMEIILTGVCGLMIALCYRMVIEYLIFLILFIPLRSYAGGLHFKAFLPCLICSAVVQSITLHCMREIQFHIGISCLVIWLVLVIIGIIGGLKGRRETDQRSEQYFKQKLKWILLSILSASVVLAMCGAQYCLSVMAITMITMFFSMLAGMVKKYIGTQFVEKCRKNTNYFNGFLR